MIAARLLAALRKKGVVVTAMGDRLRIEAPKGVLTDELREAIKERKPEIIALLRHRKSAYEINEWPAECLEAERRFGCPEARLYPLLGKEVRTPEGTGTLWQVLSVERVGVVKEVNGQKRVVYFSLEEVEPSGLH